MLLLPRPRKTVVNHLKHEQIVNRTGMKIKGKNNLPASQNDIIKDRSIIKDSTPTLCTCSCALWFLSFWFRLLYKEYLSFGWCSYCSCGHCCCSSCSQGCYSSNFSRYILSCCCSAGCWCCCHCGWWWCGICIINWFLLDCNYFLHKI